MEISMNDSQQQRQMVKSSPRRVSGLAIGIAALTLGFATSLAALALAAGGSSTITSTSNAKLGEQLVVDTQGRTLYALSPETTHRLLCKSSECLKFWPALTVRSSKTKLTAGSGVHGRLAILRRSNGTLQVTLGGLPLYRYSGDHAKGEANGQHIHSFGGTWHVISATGSASPAAPTTPAPPATQTTPGYTAPAYGTTSTPTPAPTTTPSYTTPTSTTTTPTTPSYTTPTSTTPTTPGYGY
jgi:predicted lipoprotein with Yx(FWY)xxD motif